jgi:amino acid transporter
LKGETKMADQQVTLNRVLGFWQAYGAAVGLVVAGTTMVSLSYYFGLVGPVFIVPAFIALIISLIVTLSYAELASSIPGAGMIAEYTLPAMGRSMAILGVLLGYIVLVSAAGAMESIVSGLCAETVWGINYKLFAGFLLVFFLIINLLGVEIFGKIQLLLTIVMLAALAITGSMGLLGIGTVNPMLENVVFNPGGWSVVFQSIAGGIWLYIGIEYVCPMAEEIVEPEKNIPKAMIYGLLTIFVCDVLFGEAILRYIDPAILTSSSVPQLEGVRAMLGETGVIVLAIATILAGGSSINSHIAAVPRMLYGLSRDGMMPKVFSYLHPKFRTPWVSIFVVEALLAFPLLFSRDINGIMIMISVACVTWLISYIIAQVDVIILRKTHPHLLRPFKSPFFPAPQIIGILACIYMILTIHPDPEMKKTIFMMAGAFIAISAAYSILWVKFVMKKKCFEPVAIAEIEKLTHISLEE